MEPGTNSPEGFQFSIITQWHDLGWGTLTFFQKEHIMRTYEENMNHFQSWFLKEREIGFSVISAHPMEYYNTGLHNEYF